jgi:putative flippase GtrA
MPFTPVRSATFQRFATPARRAVLVEFLRFGTVGAAGFLVDVGVLYLTRSWLGLYGAGMLSWFVAASFNWVLHRLWTFQDRARTPAHRQWAAFLSANLLGFLLNRGTYAVLITVSAFCVAYPVVAVAVGVAVSMLVNFYLSRRLVFRR